MGGEPTKLTGPDLAFGIPISDLPEGHKILGHALGEPVLITRWGGEIFAVSSSCTHYGGPLAEGLLVGETVRCPWHHACFSLRTGEAVLAPALNPIATWKTETFAGRVHVRVKNLVAPDGATALRVAPGNAPSSVVIVGAGTAGNAAAEMLRRDGFVGPITMIGAEESPAVDRPNLSKDYLAGNAPEEWIPLRPREFYQQHQIELLTGRRVESVTLGSASGGAQGGTVTLDDGSTREFDRLLLATGADPVRLQLPGVDQPHVRYLRTLADSRAIIERAGAAKHVVVIGASFIGLEVAASLRTRGLDVHVVGPEERPLARVLGDEVGDFIRKLHEEHGVIFHLGRKPASIEADAVTLDDGTTVHTDLVVIGVGVRPNVKLAESMGLKVDNGIVVDEFLETNVPGVYAAGDVARHRDVNAGAPIRIEHWVVAERLGQCAAKNLLGRRERYGAAPFFWSAHYDVTINYVGHADSIDEVQIDGSLDERNCAIRYIKDGRVAAVATIGRDLESLKAEVDMEGEPGTKAKR